VLLIGEDTERQNPSKGLCGDPHIPPLNSQLESRRLHHNTTRFYFNLHEQFRFASKQILSETHVKCKF